MVQKPEIQVALVRESMIFWTIIQKPTMALCLGLSEALPLTSSHWLNYLTSAPHFSHVQNEGDNGTFITGLLYEMW